MSASIPEIGRQAETATQEIVRNVAGATARTQEVAGSVNGQAGSLKSVVEQFLGKLISTAGQSAKAGEERRRA